MGLNLVMVPRTGSRVNEQQCFKIIATYTNDETLNNVVDLQMTACVQTQGKTTIEFYTLPASGQALGPKTIKYDMPDSTTRQCSDSVMGAVAHGDTWVAEFDFIAGDNNQPDSQTVSTTPATIAVTVTGWDTFHYGEEICIPCVVCVNQIPPIELTKTIKVDVTEE